MAALADETFLNIEGWSGQAFWEYNLLEERLFGSHIAGEKFFEGIDNFLKNATPLNYDIGKLYLSALGLGFQGKYRGLPDQTAIERYKRKLYVAIYGLPNDKNKRRPLFPEALANTISESLRIPNDGYYTWSIVFFVCVGIYLILAFGVWYSITSPLEKITRIILSGTMTLK
jgi:type VI secretion system protein ImpK